MQGSPNTELGGSPRGCQGCDTREGVGRCWGSLILSLLAAPGGCSTFEHKCGSHGLPAGRSRDHARRRWLVRLACARGGGEGGGGQCHCLWGLLPALLAAACGCATQGCGTATLTAGTLPACPATSHAGYTVRQAHKLTEQATDGQGQRLEHGEVHIQPLAIVGVCHLRCMGQGAVLGRRVSGWVTGWGRGNRAEAGRHNSKALPGVKRMQASRQRMVLACAGL